MKRFSILKRKPFLVTAGILSIASVHTLYSDQNYGISSNSLFLKRQGAVGKIVPPVNTNPVFKRSEVAKHNSKETGIWVTFEDKVYDITKFVQVHPGGDRIMLAAGKAIDPFWKIFSIHLSDETREILSQYYIGDLIPLDQDDSKVNLESSGLELLFANEPTRADSLKVLSERPFNAESSLGYLDTYITPNDHFYVRNHLPVPLVDSKEYKLEIHVPGEKPVNLSLDDLKKFPKHSVTATMQCAGNRRKEMHDSKPVKGLLWEKGAISNAVWSGVKLRDVLNFAGYNVTDYSEDKFPGDVEHVQLEGADGYGASVPVHKVLDPRGDVLLAYEMNGEELPRDHGYPLRAVISGYVAARSVKWVNSIKLDSDESDSHWQQKDYKGFSPSKDLESSDYSESVAIQELPVQSSLINEKFEEVDGHVTLRGYAIAGGGRSIVRVDVSTDGGKTWKDALIEKPDQPDGRAWAWTHWQLKVPTTGKNDLDIICKAVDSSYNTQPDSFLGIYNARGVLSSAWQRIQGKIERSK
jgi:sulfite oxidase